MRRTCGNVRQLGLLRRVQVGCLALVCTTTLGLTAQDAKADIARALWRGLSYAGNQQILSSPQNGPFFNSNQQFQRLEYNLPGRGYTFEQWRFFGPDTYNNPNTLDLGPVKFQLGRDPAIVANNEPIGLHTRAGFTTTLIPEIFFQQETAQRNQNVFAGTSTAVPSPLKYNITINTGVQDVTIDGNILLQANGRLNALGFYDISTILVNDGTYETNGVLAVDQIDTDFSIGPINVSGNIVMDTISALLQVVGFTNIPAIPTRIASGAAQRDRSLDELVAAIQAGEVLSEEDRASLISQTLQSAFERDPLGALINGLPSGNLGNDAISLSFARSDDVPAMAGGTVVPEPGTLMLLGSAGAALGWFRRRR